MRIKELVPNFLAPITSSQKVTISAVSVVFKNAGDATVTIGSHFTLKPGETFQMGVGNEHNTIITGNFQIMFGAGANPRVEIFELQPNDPFFANYEQS